MSAHNTRLASVYNLLELGIVLIDYTFSNLKMPIALGFKFKGPAISTVL